jgi:hypothetical protein
MSYQEIISLMPKGSTFNCSTPVQNTTLTVGTGTSGTDKAPLWGLNNFGESALIYTQANLGSSKQIRGIGFYFQSYTVPYTYDNVEVWLAHTTNAEFPVGTTVGYSGMTITDLTKCDVASWTVSVNNTFQFRIFNTSNFCYNGVDNLLVIVKNFDGSWSSGFGTSRFSTTTGWRTVYAGQDPVYPPNGTAMTRLQQVNNVQIYY